MVIQTSKFLALIEEKPASLNGKDNLKLFLFLKIAIATQAKIGSPTPSKFLTFRRACCCVLQPSIICVK
jgi:hypothetical protein